MKGLRSARTPLVLATEVLLARRNWSLAEFCRRLEAAGLHRGGYPTLLARLTLAVPTIGTLRIVAAGFGLDVPGLLAVMREETDRAAAEGRSVGRVRYKDPSAAVVDASA
jgi:hypothetical protein